MKVFKYGTGEEIPKGAKYLTTVAQTKTNVPDGSGGEDFVSCWLVWHYFLVEELEEEK